jgi:hypothetical protein
MISRHTFFSVSFLIFVLLATSVALEHKLFSGALVIYWAGFLGLLGFAIKKAYDVHRSVEQMAAAQMQGEQGVWLAPLSRKVSWAESEGCTSSQKIGRWQNEDIHKQWHDGTDVWTWHRNTVKDIWPKSEPLEEGVRWWKGVALYKKEAISTEAETSEHAVALG